MAALIPGGQGGLLGGLVLAGWLLRPGLRSPAPALIFPNLVYSLRKLGATLTSAPTTRSLGG